MGETLSRKHHLPIIFIFFPGVMKRELVAKADQKVNQGCEKFSGENLYRKRSSHPMMIEGNSVVLYIFWPIFLLKRAKKTFSYPWPTWEKKNLNVTWDKQKSDDATVNFVTNSWHCCRETNDKGQTKLQWDDRKQRRLLFKKDPPDYLESHKK